MTRRAALVVTFVAALVLMVCGAALQGAQRAAAPSTPATIVVHAVELDPRTGVVLWSTAPGAARVVLDPATGSPVTAGASSPAR